MPLLLDTGVLYALADASDAWHARCRDYVSAPGKALIVPVTVIPEVAYLLRERLGPREERAFVVALVQDPLRVETATRADLERCAGLLQKYPQIGFVDASVVAIAERLGVRTIATTDRRHFGPIRPRHVPAFELVP